ncbi:hypothetical protein ACFOQM_13440 [Paenibacillus sp. GCM10012307]|uniref:Uncharacterized protein n=1 Tax=Paenibacillus roseus TaxID=2798579 RepID=A0A934J5W5_9BACL|nr:hypothetical protein [Paenibacillus roseus]MBJ6362299.1 hypothetical protein [Paenibacillus roseus]
MDYNWETWSLFLKENWIMLLVALVILFIVVRIVKTVVKWAIVAVIVLVVIVYSGYNLQDLKNGMDGLKEMGNQFTDSLTGSVKQEALSLMEKEAGEAVYTSNPDGSFSVKTKNIELSGKTGEDEVAVSLRGLPIGKWKIDDTIKGLIEASKK